MVITKLARVYAKALLDFAKEIGKVEEVRKDMKLVYQVVASAPDLQVMLKSPVINADKKIGVLREVFQKHVDQVSLKLVELMVRQGREASLRQVSLAYENMYLQYKGIEKVLVTTAYELNKEELAAVEQKAAAITQKEVLLETSVDPDIIGGLILRVKDQQYNASLAHGLRQLKRQFRENKYVKDF